MCLLCLVYRYQNAINYYVYFFLFKTLNYKIMLRSLFFPSDDVIDGVIFSANLKQFIQITTNNIVMMVNCL
jgi:hypothetical protein